MENTDNWLEKYKPTKISDVVCDKSLIAKMTKFIKLFTLKKINYENINNPNLIITGSNGIGKSLIVDLMLKEFGLEKVYPVLSNISAIIRKTKRVAKTVKKTVNASRTIRTYYFSLQKQKTLTIGEDYIESKIALVIEDVSNISNIKEKEAIKALVRLNNKHKKIPNHYDFKF